MNKCNNCGKIYHNAKGLYKHLRKKHNIYQNKYMKCYHCNRNFTSKCKLIKHVQTFHKTFPQKKRAQRIKCSIVQCNCEFSSYKTLRQHLRDDHMYTDAAKEEAHEFKTIQEFESWKSNVEETCKVSFVKDSGEKKLTGDKRRSYFVCHRSYLPRCIDDANRKRSLKNSGSNKIGRACPAMLVLTVGENINVTYYSTHVGHSCNIGRRHLTKQDRNAIAGKLTEGVSMQRIIEDVRGSVSAEEIKRIHLIERKDLHNIKRDFSISYATKLHENDAISVKLWVDSMRASDNNPILYFKEQGKQENELRDDDFVLVIMSEFQQEQLLKYGQEKICIDGTHGLNSYNFQLYTIVVVDSYGSGIPAAFCFSNKADTGLFKLFFQCIKDRIGIISTKVFMSDDASSFYNAWMYVMGPATNQLLCSWHIQRNWFQNLCKISGSNAKDKRSLVFKTLKVLQSEVDEEKFYSGIKKFITDLQNDSDTISFAEYFDNIYLNRTQKWAYCHRQYLGINTNMYLESLHKKIKYSYLEGKQCKRLDKTINALLNMVRDIHYEILIKVCKNKLSSKIIEIRKSHNKSLNINPSSIDSFNGENKWTVLSSKNIQTKYLVEKMESNCSCNMRCSLCNICIHEFKCTCMDNIIHVNICKHIYLIAKQYYTVIDNNNSFDSHAIEAQNEFCIPNSTLLVNEEIQEDQEIKMKCELLLGLNSRTHLNVDKKNNIVKYLNKALTLMNEGQVQFACDKNININKNIEQQIRFFSNKKKKTTVKPILPSQFESSVIRNSFTNEDADILNIHTGFDHSYL